LRAQFARGLERLLQQLESEAGAQRRKEGGPGYIGRIWR
jgi:hypothetical protein